MAYVVDPPKDTKVRAQTINRYPWEEWADGQWWQAVRGEDYAITDAGFRSCVYNWARLNKMKAQSRRNADGVVFRMVRDG